MRSRRFATIVLSSLLAATLCQVRARESRANDLERGQELFGLCSQCHGADGSGNQLFLAPAISGLQEWYVAAQLEHFRSGARGTHPGDVGGLRMHPMSRSLKTEGDVAAVAAYVATLPNSPPEPVLEGGDSERGSQLYATCGACHGPKGEGNKMVNSPGLRDASDWYLLSTLEKYKAGVRGGNPQNINAVMMRGMATQLVDEQAMKDVIAYIMTLRDQQ